MQTRQLGQSDVVVSALGLGCWGMSGPYGSADPDEAQATLYHALDAGINLLDTADVYGNGHNETFLGKVLRGRRAEYILATKTGFVPPADAASRVWVDQRPERIIKACEASLQRLQTDVIDLYYLHRVDPQIPIEESVGAVAQLIHQGKVRFLGLCEVSSRSIERAMTVHPVTAVQSEFSLWTRDIQRQVLPLCRDRSITVVPFSPLGRGFLTGQLQSSAQIGEDDWRRDNPRFTAENLARNLKLLAPLKEIAHSHASTPAQVALAWVLAQGNQVVPIPGTRQRRHLEENLQAVDLVLTEDELEVLDQHFPLGAAVGDRYTAEFARWLDHDDR
jgi:aryl-alcohol dehydrogenase-like predicted oxidoreductase